MYTPGIHLRNTEYTSELIRPTLKLAFVTSLVRVRILWINLRVASDAIGGVIAIAPVDRVEEGVEKSGGDDFSRSIDDIIDLINGYLVRGTAVNRSSA